ncbi:MAG: HlyD family efflux transporter periplasmic adaptor subunit, partial [Thermoguttaceae bacterium]|nr:HlyD family efflux transporter periplasmic adaptor subunit [Thermoguttaceae bacterium]
LAEKYYEWVRASKSVAKAKFDLEVSQEKVEVSKAQLNAAEVQIENRKLVSPIDGFIDDVLANEGEWLREGDKVLRIIRLDKVQINGNVDAERYAPEEIDGKPATVYVKRPGAAVQTLPGKIVYVRQVVESGRYYFYADVQNAKNASGYWALNPGAMVTIVIHR